MSAAGFAKLQAFIAKAKAAGQAGPELAKAAAPVLQAQLVENIAAGRDTYGAAWKPTQEGKTPLRNAAAALTVTPTGATIVAKLQGPEARHHSGTARGRIKRRILPGSNAVPPKVVDAIIKAFSAGFKKGG